MGGTGRQYGLKKFRGRVYTFIQAYSRMTRGHSTPRAILKCERKPINRALLVTEDRDQVKTYLPLFEVSILLLV